MHGGRLFSEASCSRGQETARTALGKLRALGVETGALHWCCWSCVTGCARQGHRGSKVTHREIQEGHDRNWNWKDRKQAGK